MWRRIPLFVLISMLLIGCSHTVNVPLRPNYGVALLGKNEVSSVQPALSFQEGQFLDKRVDPTKLTTFKQQAHTYNLYEERPVKEALFEGLKTLMTNSGHKWDETQAGEVQIDLHFLNLQASRNAGMISVGASSSVQLKLDLRNAKTGDLIYSQVYSGRDERSRALIGLMDMVIESIDASIVNCINSVGSDADLAKSLKNLKSS